MRNAQPRRPPRRRPRRPTQKTPTILLAALTLASCKEDPPDIADARPATVGPPVTSRTQSPRLWGAPIPSSIPRPR